MKRLASILLYLAYLLAAVALVFYLVFWRPWVEQKRITNVPESNDFPAIRHVQPATLQKVGSLLTGKESSFIHFDHEKPAGKIRVCAIGDSFVYGDEIGVSLDYPTQLGKLFKERGYHNVEVINYGSSWHGFHQAYIIWDEIAKPMGCDFILTGPYSFHNDRDTRLNHSNDHDPYYLHSIFALNESRDDVIRVDVHGDNHAQQFDDYYRFIPNWQHLRYEDLPPPLVRSVLPSGKTIKNPFYYLEQTDATETWYILLKKIAMKSRQVVVIGRHNYISETGARFGLENYASVHVEDENLFPGRAPNKHVSGSGNQHTAQMLFNMLTGNIQGTYPALTVNDLSSITNASERHDWQKINSLEIWNGQSKIGWFIYIDHRMHMPFSLPAKAATSLINIRSPLTGLFDGVFLVVEQPITPSAPMILSDSEGHSVHLGNINSRLPALALFEKKIEGFSLGYWDNLTLNLGTIESTYGVRLNNHVTLSIGDQILLQGNVTPYEVETTLLPSANIGMVRAVAYGEGYADWQKTPETIYIRASIEEGVYSYPIGETVVVHRPIPTINGNIAHIICKSGSGGVITAATECHP